MVTSIPGADPALLRDYSFDDEEHARLRAAVKSGALAPAASLYRGRIDPPRDGDVERLPAPGTPAHAELRRLGEEALRRGEVAVVVLAGGMATRFQGVPGIQLEPGEQVVKGTVDVVDGKSFIQLKLEDARRAARAYGARVPFCVMGSFATLKGRNGLERHLQDQGLLGPDVRMFAQRISVRVTPDGEVFGAGADALPSSSYTTPGHGDFFWAIKNRGVLRELKQQGVKTIMFSNVDNLGATVDPALIGFWTKKRAAGARMLAETVERTPDDGAKTGTAVRADGLFRILEGFRIPDDVAKTVPLPEVSINTFYFDLDVLEQDVPLDVHAVKKKVDGKEAVQFETVTCEATGSLDAQGRPLLPLAVVRVPREGAVGRFRDGRFYPVKTPEDLDRVRMLLKESPVYGALDVEVGGGADKRARMAKIDRELQARFPADESRPRRTIWSPGRINLIGEHVDYQDGLALPAAVHLGVLLTTQTRDDDEVVLFSLDLEEPVRFTLSSFEIAGDSTWGRYAKAVVASLREAGVQPRGLQAVLESSLPPGSGMSSSSALCLALVKAFAAQAGAQLAPKQYVQIAQRAEHLVGVHCGNMDQSAIVNGKKDHAVLLDCRTLEVKNVPLRLGDYAIVVGNTKKPRGLVDSAYNERRRECEAAAAALARATGRDVRTLRDATVADLDRHADALTPVQRKRARHVVNEIERVRRFVAELEQGGADVATRVGALLDETHRSLRDDFEVSCVELDAMVELSRTFGGGGVCAGSRMMGGGFGGCALSLVRRGQVDAFIASVGPAYEAKTGLQPEFYVVEPDDGLTEIASRGE